MSKRRKGVGFGPRPLTQMAKAPKRKPGEKKPEDLTFDDVCPPTATAVAEPPTTITTVKDGSKLTADQSKALRSQSLAPEQPSRERQQECIANGGHFWPDADDPRRLEAEADGRAVICNECHYNPGVLGQKPGFGLPEPEQAQGGEAEGVAPQAHAPDEALELPPIEGRDATPGIWSPDSPGVPVADEENPPGDPDAVPDPPVAKTSEAPEAEPEEEAVLTTEPVRMRLQTQASVESLERVKGKILRDHHVNVLLRGPSIVRKPNGALLCVYLPGALKEVMRQTYPLLTTIRLLSDNRGLASGSVRVKAGTTRTRTKPIMSGVMGSMDPVGPMKYCRLTAYTAKNVEKWNELLPLWQAIAANFEEHVPDRFKVQMEYARRTPPEWVIQGTPFTTITINNSYSTGVHTDSGDLDEGFSTLAVARKGHYTGGILTFPQFGVGADMQDGDMILMDAHEWHGNTLMNCACPDPDEPSGRKVLGDGPCKECGAERISVVAYYRTKMEACGTYEEEAEKKAAYGARRLDAAEENAADLAAVTEKA